MSKPKIAVVIPLYNKFAYGRVAALSFFKYTNSPCHALVVDDASPKFGEQNWDSWHDGVKDPQTGKWLQEPLPRENITFHHFSENGGLTRSWNWGLQQARAMGAEYTICTNSDIHFTPHWEHGLLHHLDNGYQLVAPVTNAPGQTNGGRQRVQNFYPGYRVTDDAAYLRQVAEYLRSHEPISKVIGGLPVNGFFMMARTETWWAGQFDKNLVFDPRKKMTGNEDELQTRWKKKGWKIGFVPSSFVFHYRAVSRGERYKHRGWHRIENIHKEV